MKVFNADTLVAVEYLPKSLVDDLIWLPEKKSLFVRREEGFYSKETGDYFTPEQLAKGFYMDKKLTVIGYHAYNKPVVKLYFCNSKLDFDTEFDCNEEAKIWARKMEEQGIKNRLEL